MDSHLVWGYLLGFARSLARHPDMIEYEMTRGKVLDCLLRGWSGNVWLHDMCKCKVGVVACV